jgi:outer membrane protein OmpA-like peptidoglycan-associated protein
MNALLATTFIVTGTLLAGGCATKKYVRNTTAPIQAKVEQVGDQTNQNTQQIDDTRKQVKQVDDRAQSGISAAQERASTADQHAGEAMKSAQEAGNRATQATQMAQQNAQDLSSLRNVVSNLDDYKLQTSISVPFKFDQATLSKEAQADLDKLAGDIKSGKRFFIAVEGYTDNVGDRQYNDNLSRRRADAVMKYLVSKHDIPVYRLQMIGLGKDKPVDEARTREARAKNRRVEVKVFSADQVTAALGQGQSQNNSQGSSANRQQ